MSSYLPQEIILNILSRFQVKTLLRFRCVCKFWCKLITSHDFVQMHLNHALDHESDNCNLVFNHYRNYYSIDSFSSSELRYECIKFNPLFQSSLSIGFKNLASCNGLLCIANEFGDSFFIWNPSTKEYKEISPLPTPTTSKKSPFLKALGFGYDSKIDDYKLVTILGLEVNVNTLGSNSWRIGLDVNVYTLGSNSWRNVQSAPLNHFVPKRQSGVLLNGALHWTNASTGSEVILSFDIGHERFQEIELPHCLVVRLSYTSNVGILSGELFLLHHTNDDSCDVWVMKDYGVIESWTKLFSIAPDTRIYHYFKLIQCLKNGEILFSVALKKENDDTDESDYDNCDTDESNNDNYDTDVSNYDEEKYGLISYDAKHERVRTLKIKGIPKWFDDVETFVGTLVSPNRVLS